MEKYMKKRFIFIYLLFVSLFSLFCLPNEVFVENKNNELEDYYIFKFNTSVEEFKQFLVDCNKTFDFEEPREYTIPINSLISSEKAAMTSVTIIEIVEYANWLSKKNGLDEMYVIKNTSVEQKEYGNGYRIPSVDEWNWAASGGIKSKHYKYPGSNIYDEVAWNSNNSSGVIQIPGKKKPNELGIYDLCGNVDEVCWEQYVMFAPDVKLFGKNITPTDEWNSKFKDYYKKIYNTFSDQNFEWQYIPKKKLQITKDNIDYINKYTFYLVKEKNVSKNGIKEKYSYLLFDSIFSSVDYLGIRLVRTASQKENNIFASIIENRVRLRTEPNLQSETICFLNKNDEVTILKKSSTLEKIDNKSNYWYKIKLKNDTVGWAYGEYVNVQ